MARKKKITDEDIDPIIGGFTIAEGFFSTDGVMHEDYLVHDAKIKPGNNSPINLKNGEKAMVTLVKPLALGEIPRILKWYSNDSRTSEPKFIPLKLVEPITVLNEKGDQLLVETEQISFELKRSEVTVL